MAKKKTSEQQSAPEPKTDPQEPTPKPEPALPQETGPDERIEDEEDARHEAERPDEHEDVYDHEDDDAPPPGIPTGEPPTAPSTPMQTGIEGGPAQRIDDFAIDGGFELALDPDALSAWLKPILVLVDEAVIRVSRDGFYAAVVDPAHVAMLKTTLDRGAFSRLEVTPPTNTKDGKTETLGKSVDVGLDVEKVLEFLKLASSTTLLGQSLRVKTEGPYLIFRIGALTRRIRAVDTAGFSEPKVPDLKLPARIAIPVQNLILGGKAAESVSDHIALEADAGVFRSKAEGDRDDATVELFQADGDVTVEIKGDGVRSLFPLDYWSNILRAISPQAQECVLELGNDYPVKVAWQPQVSRAQGEAPVVIGTSEYLLAPRIEA